MFHCCFVQKTRKINQKESTPCLEEIETYVREIKVPSNKESKQLRDKKLLSHYDYCIMIVIMEKSLFFFIMKNLTINKHV